ncbi:MAG: DMT family transporter [Pseudomonadota bacterium]
MAVSTAVHNPTRGALYIVVAMLLFACQDVLIKQASEQLPVLQLLAVRTAMVTVLLMTVISLVQPRAWRPKRLAPLLLRGVLAFLAFSSYYLALAFIPLADASAVYMSAPLFVTALSVPLLGERIGRHRLIAVVAGFVGVLIVINPGASLFRVESAVPLFSALCYALIPIITRRTSGDERALTMALYTALPYLALTLLAGLLFSQDTAVAPSSGIAANIRAAWQPLDVELTVTLATTALFFTGGLLSITEAYRVAAVSALAPFEYSHLVWSASLGLLVFHDWPMPHTLLGGALIVACGCYVAYRENRQRNPT